MNTWSIEGFYEEGVAPAEVTSLKSSEKRMLIVQVLKDEPLPPRRLDSKVPRDLETICLKCIEKDPDKRYQTASGAQIFRRLYPAAGQIPTR